jgi:DNA sulfur modification protein DndC
MEAMIKNDEEKVWMTPLLELRNELDKANDRDRRDFRRMSGRVQLFHGRPVPGPYKKEWCEHWVRRVLEVQREVRRLGPPEFRNLQLISMDELHEIRRIWVYEHHWFDDGLARIYEEVTGEKFPKEDDDGNALRTEDWETLREVCGDDLVFFELQVSLLGVERQFRGMSRRAGIYDALEARLNAGLYSNEQEAVAILTERQDRQDKVGRPPDEPARRLPLVSCEAINSEPPEVTE